MTNKPYTEIAEKTEIVYPGTNLPGIRLMEGTVIEIEGEAGKATLHQRQNSEVDEDIFVIETDAVEIDGGLMEFFKSESAYEFARQKPEYRSIIAIYATGSESEGTSFETFDSLEYQIYDELKDQYDSLIRYRSGEDKEDEEFSKDLETLHQITEKLRDSIFDLLNGQTLEGFLTGFSFEEELFEAFGE